MFNDLIADHVIERLVLERQRMNVSAHERAIANCVRNAAMPFGVLEESLHKNVGGRVRMTTGADIQYKVLGCGSYARHKSVLSVRFARSA
jgi:hypothetical protein